MRNWLLEKKSKRKNELRKQSCNNDVRKETEASNYNDINNLIFLTLSSSGKLKGDFEQSNPKLFVF